MQNAIAQETAAKKRDKKQAVDAAENAEITETIEVPVRGGKTVKITPATVPTGIFPLPDRFLHWAGLR